MSPAQATGQRRLAAVLGSLMLVMLLAALDQTIVATALPTIVGDLGGLQHLSWVVTAYLLAVTVVTPLYGKLGDQYGRKIVLQSALGLFLLGSVLCGQAHSMTELILFRGVQGLGGGGVDEVERRPALHLDRGPGVMAEHEYGGMKRRVVSPPALPLFVRPRSALGSELIPAHDLDTDA